MAKTRATRQQREGVQQMADTLFNEIFHALDDPDDMGDILGVDSTEAAQIAGDTYHAFRKACRKVVGPLD